MLREEIKMYKALPIVCLLGAVGLAVVAGGARLAHVSQAEQRVKEQHVRVVDVSAKKYEFAPSPIRIPLGATTQLKITSLDKTHGFKINLFPDGSVAKGNPGLLFSSDADCFKIEPTTATLVEFAARTPGTYLFHCCNRCGPGHGGMKGQLVV